MRILLTGFEPFGEETINPSWEAVKCVSSSIEGHEVVKAEIEVTFEGAAKQIKKLLDEVRPDILLMVGQRGGSCEIDCERIAINMANSVKPDNSGYSPKEETLVPGAPAAYFGTQPVQKVVDALHEAGIPALVSNSAGLYVCNCLYFNALHHCQTTGICRQVGFIHVPYLPEQALTGKKASMSLQMTTQALEIALKSMVNE